MKSVQFTKGEGRIQVFFDYNEQFENIMIQHSPRTRTSKKANTKVLVEPQFYSCQKKITSQKYFDLIKLCKQEIIPIRYHDENKNLSPDKNILDMLPETDEEDDVLEENTDFEIRQY